MTESHQSTIFPKPNEPVVRKRGRPKKNTIQSETENKRTKTTLDSQEQTTLPSITEAQRHSNRRAAETDEQRKARRIKDAQRKAEKRIK